jgi:hypothetical protein
MCSSFLHAARRLRVVFAPDQALDVCPQRLAAQAELAGPDDRALDERARLGQGLPA